MCCGHSVKRIKMLRTPEDFIEKARNLILFLSVMLIIILFILFLLEQYVLGIIVAAIGSLCIVKYLSTINVSVSVSKAKLSWKTMLGTKKYLVLTDIKSIKKQYVPVLQEEIWIVRNKKRRFVMFFLCRAKGSGQFVKGINARRIKAKGK